MKKVFRILSLIIGGLAGFGIAYAGLYYLEDYNSFSKIIIIGGSIFASIVIGITAHEFGHLVAGLASGYKFLSFRVLNLILVKYDEGHRLRKYSIPGTLGQCLMKPPGEDSENYPFKLYNYGGWMANTILSTTSVLIILVSNIKPIWVFFFIIFAVINIYMALSNGVPLKISGIANDGENVRTLKTNLEMKKAFWNTLKVNELLTLGTRYSQIPDKYLERPLVKNYLTSSIPSYQAVKLLDNGDYQGSLDMFREIIREWKPVAVNEELFKYDVMFCKIILKDGNYKDDIERNLSRKFLKLDKNFKVFLRRNRFWILYYNTIEINPHKAEKYKREFDNLCRTYPLKGEIMSETHILSKALCLVESRTSNV